MPKRLVLKQPTPEEIEQLNLVAEAHCNMHRRLADEGIHPDLLLDGLAAAAAALVEELHGPEMVADWFRAHAGNAENVLRRQSN